jgi:hypothetical protein
MAGNGDEIDIESSIGAVKNYAELWNVATETYRERNKKKIRES